MALVGFSPPPYNPQAFAKPQVRHSLIRGIGASIASSSSSSSSCSSSSIPSRRFNLVGIFAQVLPFRARKQVNMPFEGDAPAPELYVKEVERVVKITFPDSARIRYLGDSTWRATLKPVTFFHLSATPACDIRVFHENKALKISSNKLTLDFKGVPVQFKYLDFDFSLLGQLTVKDSSLYASGRGQNKSFQGSVDLGLKVDMPLPFSMMPEAILLPVGNGILDRILGAMESALLAGLIQDYKQWCRKQADQRLSLLSDAAASS